MEGYNSIKFDKDLCYCNYMRLIQNMRKALVKNFLFFCLICFVLFECSCSIYKESKQNIGNLIDINGDKQTDLVFWMINSPDCFFETITPQNTNYRVTSLGNTGDIPIYGDFTGDGNTDYGVYKYSKDGNKWHLIDGVTMKNFWERLGKTGDLPVQGDYDGDGKSDYVVYRPSNSGFYGRLSHKNKELEIHFGVTGDIPVPKDYDGDGKADLATYRNGVWLIKSSRTDLSKQSFLGSPSYLPIPADYDGDGKVDLAVWNYNNNNCKVLFSSFFTPKLSKKNSLYIQEKLKDCNCFPVSSDFDGDGKCELAFWDYEKNAVHIFKVNKNIKYEQVKISVEKGSKPINYYLLNKFLNRVSNINCSLLYKRYKSSIEGNKDMFLCDIDGDFINDFVKYDTKARSFICKLSSNNMEQQIPFVNSNDKFLAGDFDGDGKCDVGGVNLKEKTFTYISSALENPISIRLDRNVEGEPFSIDLDLDFMSDIVFYNPLSKIFGFVLSSEAYRYDEILYKSMNNKE